MTESLIDKLMAEKHPARSEDFNNGLELAIRIVRDCSTPDHSVVERVADALAASFRGDCMAGSDDAIRMAEAAIAAMGRTPDSEVLASIAGTLEPLADLDWHGKWRIQKAIELARGEIRVMGTEAMKPTSRIPGGGASVLSTQQPSEMPEGTKVTSCPTVFKNLGPVDEQPVAVMGECANLVSAAGDAGNNQETGARQAQHGGGNTGSPATQQPDETFLAKARAALERGDFLGPEESERFLDEILNAPDPRQPVGLSTSEAIAFGDGYNKGYAAAANERESRPLSDDDEAEAINLMADAMEKAARYYGPNAGQISGNKDTLAGRALRTLLERFDIRRKA